MVDPVPNGQWHSTTMLAAIRIDGVIPEACFALKGAMTLWVFRYYVEQMLAPTLRPGDIVLSVQGRDDLAPHRVKGAGTLNNVNITGTDAPGFSTASVIRGSVTYGGTLEIEIGGTSPGSGYDQINHVLGSGDATLGGALDLEVIGPYTPTLGDTFDVIDFTTGSGHFGAVQGISLDYLSLAHLSLAVLYEADALLYPAIGVDVRVSLSGDVTLDDVVGVGDLAAMASNWGMGNRWRLSDLNGDYTVGVGDLAILALHWGNNAGNTSLSGASVVPLPSAGLAGLVLIAMGSVRRRAHGC